VTSGAPPPAYVVAPVRLRLAEPAPEPLSEADLSQVWEGQRFPPEALVCVDGRAVEVVHPGRRGGGGGPDFVDAVLLLDGKQACGDVELHVRASSFHAHGHDTDPAYDRLALHVVYRADTGPETRLSDGRRAPVAAFAPWLERRGAELAGWLGAPSMWQEPCRGVTARLGESTVRETLERAGSIRFEARTAAMRRAVRAHGPEEALWRTLLDALGVGGDRPGFRRLAESLPASLAVRSQDPEGVLLHAAGLAPPPPDCADLPVPLQTPLSAAGRPANHPRRRLAGLALLLRRAASTAEARAPSPLAAYALASVRQAEDARPLLARWQAARDGAPLIGPGRAQELLVNAVLPFAAARGLEDEALRHLAALPAAPAYGRTAFLESNLRPARGRIVRGALQQQGLLWLIAEWCSKGGCGRCPLS
jgi:hypothetical protein